MKYENIREEELKNKIAQDCFRIYDCTKIIGDVDFCVSRAQAGQEWSEQESLLWAEAKKGSSNIYHSMVQLILTIGKARTFDHFLPPPFLGAFDGEKIGFIPYNEIHEIFYQNDFNWNVAPSNHETKEFRLVLEKVTSILDKKTWVFDYQRDEKELKEFIKSNFVVGKFGLAKTQIDKNNFMVIYNKWLQTVKPTIRANWDIAKKRGIIDGDFYLADLLSQDDHTLKEKLFVLLKRDHYELDRFTDELGMFSSKRTDFTDNQIAHAQFWNKYGRPPKEEYWDYIVERRDLLVPQDVRERKGSFFTPQIWVELSQKYLADVLGKDWQDEYYVWDCAAGTGNLLHGLVNKYNIWASTIDKQDVDVMHDRIKNGANLLHDHVFPFDFLNDDFSKLPKPLQNIINDSEKRKKLVVYINPPYAEASSYGYDSVPLVAIETEVFQTSKDKAGSDAMNELFAQFFIRINHELPGAKLASFSTMKFISSQKFNKFRNHFRFKFERGFVVPANTFDNVKGEFPVGFTVWSPSDNNATLTKISTDVYLKNQNNLPEKSRRKIFYTPVKRLIGDWRSSFYSDSKQCLGYMIIVGPSMQSNNNTFITSEPKQSYIKKGMVANIVKGNLLQMAIYLAIRHVISATWLNKPDQFLYPNKGWEKDSEFQNDCLAYTLFHGKNRISSKDGTNHWLPFTEKEVDAREKFESNFMVRFIKGKIKPERGIYLFSVVLDPGIHYDKPLKFSQEAKEVFDAGRALWRYYHQQPKCDVNASLYDIREHFQGRNKKGKMNNKSGDTTYMQLIGELRNKLKRLATTIAPKVYEYGFLKN